MARRNSRRRSGFAMTVGAVLLCAACGQSGPPAAAATSSAAGKVFPLTGLPAGSVRAASQPALAVKIDNIAQARPQFGLDKADVVWDTPVEGGLTRLFAVFQSRSADVVGPVRSARPVDADLLQLLRGGVFAYSGADPREIAPVKARSGAVLVSNDDHPGYFYRSGGRQSPDNVLSSTTRLLAAGRALGRPSGPPPQLFTYAPAAPRGAVTSRLDVVFSPYASAGWRRAGSRYQRLQDSTPDRLQGGARIATDNVVILSVQLRGTGIFDAAHNEDPLVVLTGRGQAWLMRDGVMVKGTWSRGPGSRALALVGADGRPMALRPGSTWVELLPRGRTPLFRP